MSLRASSLLVAAGLLALAPYARADLPPPDGKKFVGFSFSVDNVSSFKDFALLAFPCSSSNGVPVVEMAELKEGTSVSVGRRGGNCKLYAMPRADLDAWRKGVTSNKGDEVEALFKSPKVRACTGGPDIVHTLPVADPRDVATQVLHVAQLDATACSITAPGSGAGTAPATNAGAAEPPPVNRGCAGCSVPGAPMGAGAVAAALSLVALALRRARKAGR
jgi:MYXO-CTERM domain-containing protein